MDPREELEVQMLGGYEEHELKQLVETESKKAKKRGYRKGFLSGIALMLVIVVAFSTSAAYVLSSRGYVLSSFKLDDSVTDNILGTEVENKIAEIYSALSQYYYDDLDDNQLAIGMYKGLVDSLGDKYSGYYTRDEYAEYLSSTNGTYYGIGAVLSQDLETNLISISKVYKGSPAEEAGLKDGDVFVSADGEKAEGLTVSEFVTHVKGDEGTKVELVVLRDGEEMTFQVERRKVEIPTVESKMLENHTGYIQIQEFDQVTADQFHEALTQLKKEKMTSLIVDLRGNPGGIITTVCDVLDEILPKGLLVYTQDKSGEKIEYKSDKKELEMPLAVLVDENSASASEIFAGAVKDYGYGTLIGTKTFGKGIVQVLMPLSDGSAVKMTTAKYFTPKGNYIHGVGIEPDIELEYEFMGEKGEEYDIMKDNQVLKALEILNQ